MQETHPDRKCKELLSGFAEGTFAVVLTPGPFKKWTQIQTGMSGRCGSDILYLQSHSDDAG